MENGRPIYDDGRTIYVLRGAFVPFITFLIKSAVYFITVVLCRVAKTPFTDFPDWYISLLAFFATLFIYNSVCKFTATYDRIAYEEFMKENREVKSRRDELPRLLRSTGVLIGMASSIVVLLIITLLGGFSDAMRAIPIEMPIMRERILSFFVLLVFFIPIDILGRIDVRRFFRDAKRFHEEDKLFRPQSAILRALVIIFLYPIAFPFTPLLLFAAWTIIGVIGAALGAIGPPVISTAVVSFFILFFVMIKIMRRRRRFKKKSKRLILVSEEQGYTVELSKERGERRVITLTRGDERYTATVLSPWSRGRGLYFTSEEDAYTLIKIGTRRHNLSFQHKFKYGFSGEGRRLLIIEPIPNRVFVTDGVEARELFFGDGIWDATIYDLTSLSGFIERDILGVKRGRFE